MGMMKKLWISCLLALVATSVVLPEKVKAQVGVSISYQTFYDELSPYGRWINYANYGSVWVPDAGPDFQPYATNGHWVITEYGNTWVSDYDWGWAPFHYGRWLYDDLYGWVWVPGTEWGPAWVSWRSGGGYYGWAPLGPGVSINVNINIPLRHWVFVPQIYITSPRVYTYCVPRARVVNFYKRSNYIRNVYRHNNQVYVYGPRRDEIERVTRSRVQVHRVDNMDRPGRYDVRDGSVRVYRPEVSDNRQNTGRPERIANGTTANNRGNYSTSSKNNSRNRSSSEYDNSERVIRNNSNSRGAVDERSSRVATPSNIGEYNSRTQRQQSSNADRTTYGRTSRGEAMESRTGQQPSYERSQQQRTEASREPIPQPRTQREVQTQRSQRSQTRERQTGTVRPQRSEYRSERQSKSQQRSTSNRENSSRERN